MRGARTPAGGLLFGSVLCACTMTTELLPPTDAGVRSAVTSQSFCPTTIDVYGGINMVLEGCGGPSGNPAPLEGGNSFFSGFGDAGGAQFANTMAGILQARLAADPDLTTLFGSNWQVRSCAASTETLTELVAPLSDDNCGNDAPNQMGALSSICSNQPAPLVLLSAGGLDDRCHGGGGDSSESDDPTTFASHFASRLDSFLIGRRPKMAIVGPQTEWFPLPQPQSQDGQPGPGGRPQPSGATDHSACQWQRPDWAVTGLNVWQSSHAATAGVVAVGQLHDQFKQHTSCCQALGITCASSWFASDGPVANAVNCDGAQALADFWYEQLKTFLQGNRFTCP